MSLQDVIPWRTEDMYLPSGESLLAASVQPGGYYKDFFGLVSSAPKGLKRYQSRLRRVSRSKKWRETWDGIVLRAELARTASRFRISYQEAWEYLPHVAVYLSSVEAEEIIDQVVRNYLDMAAAPTAYQVIGRLDDYGRFVLVEGIHRALINLANGFQISPVAVVDRSPQWIEFIRFFEDESQFLYQRPNALYHAVRHPDFASFHVIRESRFAPIYGFLRERQFHSGVDLGSHIGEYSHRLSEAGIHMCAFEFEEKYSKAMSRLNVTYGVNVVVRHQDILCLPTARDRPDADFVLMLSVLYHLLRRDEPGAISWLEEMKDVYACFIVDTEPRTGVLPAAALKKLFRGFNATLLHTGVDDRQVFAFEKRLTARSLKRRP